MAVSLDTYIQYQDAPRLNNFITGLQNLLNQYNMDDLDRTLDINNATGYQLNYIGKLVGFSRPSALVDDSLNWDVDNWDEDNWGSDSNNQVALSDSSYRKLLLAWCSQLFNVITVNSIYQTLDSAFGKENWVVVSTAGNIEIRIPNTVSANDIVLIRSGILQAPQGVTISYTVLP